jgi:predicted amidohydrolase
VRENLEHVASALAGTNADLIVLPELPFTGYCFRDRAELLALAEDPAESPTVDRLAALSEDLDCHIVTGFAERSGEHCFNSALLLGPEGLLRTYRKLHLFDAEKDLFDPGDRPPAVDTIRGMRIGMMICFDWIFPETARVLAVMGADVIAHPANLVLGHCQQAMLVRCLENGVFAVTANRTGTESGPEGEIAFTGESQIAAPKGELIHRGGSDGEELYFAEIDIARARDKMVTARNHVIDDRRPEFYERLSHRPE